VIIISLRRASRLALSLLVAAVAPAACAVDSSDPSSHEDVSSAKQAVTPAPNHEWLFQETGGTTTSDAVAVGPVTGTLGASASLGGGEVTLSANGAYDPASYVDFGTTAAAFGTGDFTVAHWYQTTFSGDGNLGDILGNRVDSSGGTFFSARLHSEGYVTFEIDDGANGDTYASASTSATVNDGAWHHLAYVRQGTTVTIYVDGVASGSDSAGQVADVADASTASFRIGRTLPNCCGNFLTVPAAFEDLRIYDSALGASDIAGIVAGSGAASCAPFTYDCNGDPVNGCTSTVPCATGGTCADGSGCASGVCSGGACQAVVSWECSYNCWNIDAACRDAQGVTLDACIAACDDNEACLDGCSDAYYASYAQCDAAVPACAAVCNGSCSDGVQDDGETGVDCGGPCAACRSIAPAPVAVRWTHVRPNLPVPGLRRPGRRARAALPLLPGARRHRPLRRLLPHERARRRLLRGVRAGARPRAGGRGRRPPVPALPRGPGRLPRRRGRPLRL
jgi:hypothetical protein